jgi:type VI secretion system protein ImpF
MPAIGIKEGARAPLFDRLSETPEGGTRAPAGVLDRAGQCESLQRELERLLNTRSPSPSGKLAPPERTVIDYGLPDYSAMYTRSREDQKELAGLVRETIEAFEPRLSQVKVEAEVLGDGEKAVLVKVTGAMAIGRITERVSFAVQVSGADLRGSGLGS